MEKASEKRAAPPIVSELEAVAISQNERREGKRGSVKRIVDGPVVDKESSAYP